MKIARCDQNKFLNYLNNVDIAINQYPSWRVGQSFFNILYEWYPEISEQIRSSEIDPFYQDNKIPLFLIFVKNKLEEDG